MKTDRFMQGILINDEDELFTYPFHHPSHGVRSIAIRLRSIKSARIVIRKLRKTNKLNQNRHAVFSKSSVDGDISQAIADVRDRLSIRPPHSED